MAEVFVEFEDQWPGPDGKAYEAQVCGRQGDDPLCPRLPYLLARCGAAQSDRPQRADRNDHQRGGRASRCRAEFGAERVILSAIALRRPRAG